MKYLLLSIFLLGTSATYSQSGKFAASLISSITDTLAKADAVEKKETGVKSSGMASNESIAEVFSVSTLAGAGMPQLLNAPSGVAVDAQKNVYVADAANNVIKKISSNGTVTTLAGCGTAGSTDGTTKASFYFPVGIAIDALGNVYVADKGNHKIRKITPAGVVTTLAGNGTRGAIDGMGKNASFDKPVAVAVDAAGNVFVADQCNHKIRKISPEGVVSTVAGCGKPGADDGAGKTASFRYPAGIAVDQTGNLYVADYNNNKVRKIVANTIDAKSTDSNTTALLLQGNTTH